MPAFDIKDFNLAYNALKKKAGETLTLTGPQLKKLLNEKVYLSLREENTFKCGIIKLEKLQKYLVY